MSKGVVLIRGSEDKERVKKFKEVWFMEFDKKYVIQKRLNGRYSIVTCEHGFIDFYPKKNILFFKRTKEWRRSNALNWLINNLL